MTNKIGFIGVGMMGHGMIKNLLENDYDVVATAHRNRAPLEDLLAKGATEAKTPKAIAEASDIIIICVTGSPQVEAVAYGEDGFLAGISKGMTVIDCSTGEPGTVEKIAAELADRGADMADAPLARTPVEAEAGNLNTMVGASDAVFARIEPVLKTFCENIFHMGPVGSGSRMKLINNLITMGQATLIAEAMCACKATGVDLQRFRDVISAGGGNSGIFQMIVPAILDDGDFEGMKFSIANATKDLRYLNRMLADAGVVSPLGNATHSAFLQAGKDGFDDGLVGH
ncbi:MAG: NAD(P)-dependent oxidoreductase, partial [Rhodospirillaceae bacterium]|nr:NAD(P)-dependent oxidoreductase [Rhodospirillaceae bacterium]